MYRLIILFLLAALTLSSNRAMALEFERFQLSVPTGLKEIITTNRRVKIEARNGAWWQLGERDGKPVLNPAASIETIASGDPNQLPDTEIAVGTKNIKQAWLARPTERYDHGVLGDAIEAGSLKIVRKDGITDEILLPENAVFEDRIPRLVDMDQDGNDEVVVVKSYVDQGAAVALIGRSKDGYAIVAESKSIGLSHRWLNPIGAADFDGDGKIEFAVVITPHIGGTLQLYEWHKQNLVADHSAFGFSNHAMGSRELGLSAIIDLDQDGIMDIFLPDASRQALVGVSFAGGQAKMLGRFSLPHSLISGLHASDFDRNGRAEIVFSTSPNDITILRQSP